MPTRRAILLSVFIQELNHVRESRCEGMPASRKFPLVMSLSISVNSYNKFSLSLSHALKKSSRFQHLSPILHRHQPTIRCFHLLQHSQRIPLQQPRLYPSLHRTPIHARVHGMVPLYKGFAQVLGLGIPARRGRVTAALDSLADDVEAVVKVLLAVVARECGVKIGVAAFDPVLRCVC